MGRRLVVEADGGSRGNPGVAGYGALVRDRDTGRLLAERAEPLGQASNNVAEYRGLIAGLLAAEALDPGAEVVVRMDSKLVVEQMSGRWKLKHADMRTLAAQAREVVARLATAGGSVRYEWIPRAENAAADKLSNDGMDGLTIDRTFSERGPEDGADAEAVAPPTARSEPDSGSGSGSESPSGPDDPQPAGRRLPRRETAPADLGAPVRVVLVRHGETEHTRAGVLDGRDGPDAPLTAQGRAQAVAAAAGVHAFLGGQPVRVVTSSLARARQTGAVIADRLGVEPEVDARLDEQGFGDWEGARVADVATADPAAYARLRADDHDARPGGESREELRERVLAAYDDIRALAATDGRTPILVGHRTALLVLLGQELGLSTAHSWSLALSPASLTSVKRWADGGVLVEFVNDTSHLRS